MAEESIPTGKRHEITVVAEDKNWRSYIANELACADRWNSDWGFLAGGALEGKYHMRRGMQQGWIKLNFGWLRDKWLIEFWCFT